MRKILIVLTLVMVLVACSKVSESELDKELQDLLIVKEYPLDREKDEDLVWRLEDIKDGALYYTQWLDEGRVVQKGILKVEGNHHEIILDTQEMFSSVEAYIESDGRIYYVSHSHDDPTVDEDGEIIDYRTRYDMFVYEDGEHKKYMDFEGEGQTHVPVFFELKDKIFVAYQFYNYEEEYLSVYNISDEKEELRVNKGVHELENGVHDRVLTKGIEKDKVAFVNTVESDSEIKSMIYIFDGIEIKEYEYEDIHVEDILFVQDTLMLNYYLDETEERMLAYIDANGELVKTDIKATGLDKVMDIKDGAIVHGNINESSLDYHYLTIDNNDVNVESLSFLKNNWDYRRVSDGYLIFDRNERVLKVYKTK